MIGLQLVGAVLFTVAAIVRLRPAHRALGRRRPTGAATGAPAARLAIAAPASGGRRPDLLAGEVHLAGERLHEGRWVC